MLLDVHLYWHVVWSNDDVCRAARVDAIVDIKRIHDSCAAIASTSTTIYLHAANMSFLGIEGYHAFVTGARGGIGRAIVAELLGVPSHAPPSNSASNKPNKA